MVHTSGRSDRPPTESADTHVPTGPSEPVPPGRTRGAGAGRRRLPWTAYLLVLLALPACATGREAGPTPDGARSSPPAAQVQATRGPGRIVDPALAGIDSLLASTYPKGGPGAAVVAMHIGRVVLRNAYGNADVELDVPMTPEHVFRLASITKQFTAVAILMLAEEGKLGLSDEITRFFPDWPTHGHRITIEHLLNHTSGIPSYTNLPAFGRVVRNDMTAAEIIALFRDEPMDFPPGEDYRYNNSAYTLLGAIIEQVSGQDYGTFLQQRIFEPLGMRHTRLEDLRTLIPGRVKGYAVSSEGTLGNAGFLSMTIPHSGGSLISTVDDQLVWHQAVAAGKLLRPDTWSQAFSPFMLNDGRMSNYGYGWFLGSVGGAPTVEHGGDIFGFSTESLWIPSAGVHVVVLTNAERGLANPASISLAIAETLTGVVAPEPPPPLTAAEMDAFVGTYQEGENVRQIVREGDTLLVLRGGTRQVMEWAGDDTFVIPASRGRVIFRRDGAGRVDAVRVESRLGAEQRWLERGERVGSGARR